MTDARDVSTLVDVRAADVYKAGVHLARLELHDDHVSLSYLPDHVDGPAIATTLPATQTATRTAGRAVPAFFAGLLPEGRRLTALRTALKTSADDDFSMLLAVGGDMVGDIQVVPAGTPPPALAADSAHHEPFDMISFTELFERATGASPDRGGLAGVQDKVSGRMISVPVTARGAAYLLKLDPPEFPHLVTNEALFLEIARACGLVTVNAEVVRDREGQPGLLIERFDRVISDGVMQPRAVEDGCQALGRYPADKYALTTEHVTTTLSQMCDAQLPALRAMFRQVVFALATGNGDLHAKNVSVVHDGSEWMVSPAYDLPSSYPYGDSTLALSLQGSREGQVSRRRLLEFAAAIGMPERAAVLSLDDLLDRIEPQVARVEELAFDERRVRRLRRFIQTRLNLLRGETLAARQ